MAVQTFSTASNRLLSKSACRPALPVRTVLRSVAILASPSRSSLRSSSIWRLKPCVIKATIQCRPMKMPSGPTSQSTIDTIESQLSFMARICTSTKTLLRTVPNDQHNRKAPVIAHGVDRANGSPARRYGCRARPNKFVPLFYQRGIAEAIADPKIERVSALKKRAHRLHPLLLIGALALRSRRSAR